MNFTYFKINTKEGDCINLFTIRITNFQNLQHFCSYYGKMAGSLSRSILYHFPGKRVVVRMD